MQALRRSSITAGLQALRENEKEKTMAEKKNTTDKNANVHLHGAKESANFKRENGDVIKSARSTKERSDSNRLH